MTRPALPSDDNPVDPFERDAWDRTKKRFKGEEAYRGRDFFQISDSPEVAGILHRNALPHMMRPWQAGRKASKSLCSLGEDLENVPVRLSHDLECLMNEVFRYSLVEEVAHAVDKNPPRLCPPKRKRELVRMEGYGKSISVARVAHRLKPSCQALGIAVFAPWADLRAPGDRVPGSIRPLDA